MNHPDVAAAADRVVAALEARPATLGEGRLLCLDGPAGSGKTTLAAAVHERMAPGTSAVVHTDALLQGWDGLPGLDDDLAALLGPLAGGRPGTYRRYDWLRGMPSRPVTVEPRPLVVVEGVGAGGRATDPWRTLLVWVEVDADVRDRRWLARDGELMRPHMAPWRDAEERLFAVHDTRRRADLVVFPHEHQPER